MCYMKYYMHYNRLVDYINHKPVLVTPTFVHAEDIEVYINTKDVIMLPQKNGVLISRKKIIKHFSRKTKI